MIVLNKADLVDDADRIRLDTETRCIGSDVVLASIQTLDGVKELQSMLGEGVTAAFLGPSGVGKSSLINRLAGENRMDTGDVRGGDHKGRHTTVHRQMIQLPGGGLVIDTPGLRELQLVDDEGIGSAFPEIDALANRCRFRDCTHRSEPGCAVRAAAEDGSIQRERYEHFLKLVHDAEVFDLRQDERLRRKTERQFAKRLHEGKMIRRLKGDR